MCVSVCVCVSVCMRECVSVCVCVCVCVCVSEREREIREFGTNGLFFQASLGCETPGRRGRR